MGRRAGAGLKLGLMAEGAPAGPFLGLLLTLLLSPGISLMPLPTRGLELSPSEV